MELKDYQQQALDTLDRYLEALNAARQQIDAFDISALPPDLREQFAQQAAN